VRLIQRVAKWVVVGAGGALVLELGRRSWDWPLVHDAPLMHYVAWRIGQGAVPYRDVFDMNFPGVYVLHLIVVKLGGTGDLAWRVFDLGWLAMSAGLIAMFVAPWGRAAAAAAGVMFALYHLAGGAWQAGQRDFLLCLFLLAGALGVTRWLESPERAAARGALAGGGLALGAATTIKPHAIALAAALGALVVLAAWRAGGSTFTPVVVFIAAAVASPVAAVLWLGAAGALPAWRAIVFEYLVPLYSRLGDASGPAIYRLAAWRPLAAGAVVSIASAVVGKRFGVRHGVAALGALYGVFHFQSQGKGWEYHLYPLAAFAIMLLFAEVEPVVVRRRWGLVIPIVVAILTTGGLLAAKAVAASAAGWERAKAERVRTLADEMAPWLEPGDTVQVFDTTGGGIHALLRLGVRQPTRFIYDFHFFHDTTHPTVRGLRDELVRDLDAYPPRLIVLFEEAWPAGGYERVNTFPALRARLAEYDLVRPGPRYRIYAQRHRP
jgi:hypothetical protein